MLKKCVKRMERKLEAEINVVQAGFRQGRGTRDHIFNLRMIIQKCREFNQPLFTCFDFVDYTKAFDSVEHQQLWTVMREMGFQKKNRVANRSSIRLTTICSQNRQWNNILV